MHTLFFGYCSLLTAFSVPSICMAAAFFFIVTLIVKLRPEVFFIIDEKKAKKSDSYALYQEIVALMEESQLFLQKGLSLEDVSSCLLSNRTYVSNCINEFSGKSFCDFVNAYRVDYAKALISWYDSKMSLASVAETSGFESESTFIRNFKKVTGFPPMAWKKRYMEGTLEYAN